MVLHEDFYCTLPALPTVDPGEADIAWLIYGLELDAVGQRYRLVHRQTEYTAIKPALEKLLAVPSGDADEFSRFLDVGLSDTSDS